MTFFFTKYAFDSFVSVRVQSLNQTEEHNHNCFEILPHLIDQRKQTSDSKFQFLRISAERNTISIFYLFRSDVDGKRHPEGVVQQRR